MRSNRRKWLDRTIMSGMMIAAAWPASAQTNSAPAPMGQMGGMSMAPAAPGDDRKVLLDRIDTLEKRLAEIESRLSGAPSGVGTQASVTASPSAEQPQVAELNERLTYLETNAVMSEPKTTVKRVEMWVDKDGVQHDEQVPGAHKEVTYQREATSRRQAIGEEIEEALADAESRRVSIGVNSAITFQHARQLRGPRSVADGHSYTLASADLTFTAGLAQNTMFFADVVGLTGNPPDGEVQGLTLLNSYTARLSRENELNLREAWIKTQLFNQTVDVTLGRLDLTNYFDRNTAANDETSMFLSDSLVNNPALGLASNGPGVAIVYQPYTSFAVKVGAQQSNPKATNLSESVFALAEVDYLMRPFGLPEGNYRVWFRTDNSSRNRSNAWGVSIDQKLVPQITLFGRYGGGKIALDDVTFYSGGLQFTGDFAFTPQDNWGIGYSHTTIDPANPVLNHRREDLTEFYYNLHLAEKLHLSPHIQYVRERDGLINQDFILPGLRLQASF